MNRPGRRRLRVLIPALAAGALLAICCCGNAVSFFLGGLGKQNDDYAYRCGQGGSTVDVNTSHARVQGLGDEQMHNSAAIIAAGQKMGVPPRGWVIAIATSLQETWLRNLGHLGAGNNYDSVGLFQQRPSMGWGTPEQIKNPDYAARKFFEHLLRVPGWQSGSLTDDAQAVQRSATPSAYAKHEPMATEIVNALTNGAARAVGAKTELQCVGSFGEIAASGWTIPAQGGASSGYRTPDRPTHDGIDIMAHRGSEIHAASAGVVATVLCNASTGDCDHDGSPSVSGCGWYLDINHAGGIITRYCHMLQRPFVKVGDRVTAGQVIGKIGSSGNSSGPHLHFEVHLGGDPNRSGATNPGEFMKKVGAPLEIAAP